MSAPSTLQFVDAATHSLLTLVWVSVAQSGWRFRRTRRPHSRFFRMMPYVAGAVAVTYGFFSLITLIPDELRRSGAPGVAAIFGLHDAIIFAVVAVARHMAWYFPTPERLPPRRVWLVALYGSAACMGVVALTFVGVIRLPVLAPGFTAYYALRVLYQIALLSTVLWELAKVARPGRWTPGGAAWVARRADVLVLAGALISLSSWLFVACTRGWGPQPVLWESSVRGIIFDTLTGVGFAVPLAVRALGAVVRTLVTVSVMLLGALAIYVGAHDIEAAVGSANRPLIDVLAVVAVVALLGPGQSGVRAVVEHVVFRRSRRRGQELHDALYRLAPELGVATCCERIVREVSRIMQLRGAAILRRDGGTSVHGDIVFEPLERLWRHGAGDTDFPVYALVGYELRALPDALLQAVSETNVVGLIPIASPRHQWGLLLISTSLLGATFSDEDEQVLQGVADQLALLLDAAELLARTVAVERSLAHSEKLAAIGELAARVAHEIRNPVTAARSLAQQLGREPTSPLNAEHAGVILAELERVERQVAALLRFARRDEFRFEPTDLGELTQHTVDALRARLEASDIAVAVDVPRDLVAPADPEKLRQVLVNLVENAVDALRDTTGPRRLQVALRRDNGGAALLVSDTGPGVAAEALPRLFEPFFSLKPNGTGLGLAIARRAVEAHGGTLRALRGVSGGMTFRIDLPLRPQESALRTQD